MASARLPSPRLKEGRRRAVGGLEGRPYALKPMFVIR